MTLESWSTTILLRLLVLTNDLDFRCTRSLASLTMWHLEGINNQRSWCCLPSAQMSGFDACSRSSPLICLRAKFCLVTQRYSPTDLDTSWSEKKKVAGSNWISACTLGIKFSGKLCWFRLKWLMAFVDEVLTMRKRLFQTFTNSMS